MGQRDGETSGQEVKGQDPPGGEGSAPGGQGGGLPFAERLLGPPQATHVPRHLPQFSDGEQVQRRTSGLGSHN